MLSPLLDKPHQHFDSASSLSSPNIGSIGGISARLRIMMNPIAHALDQSV